VGFWSGFDDLRKNWAVEKIWQPNMSPDRRAKGYREWKKAVKRTLDWVE